MHKIKPWEELTFQDDYMFHAVMRRKSICKATLERILRVPIRDIVYLEDEKTINPAYSFKGVRLDVYVADDAGSVYDVEMQVREPRGIDTLPKRTRYYQSMIDLELLPKGASYSYLKPCFIIFLCPFDPFGLSRPIYTFHYWCDEVKTLPLGDGTTRIFLNARGNRDNLPADLKAFLDYMLGLPASDSFLEEIEQTIREVKQNEKEMKSYMTYEMKLQEMFDDGMEKGKEQGGLETTQAFVLKMLRDNADRRIISRYTDLSLPEIEKIARENNL